MSGGLAPNLNIVTTTISGSGGSQTTVVVSYSINNSGRTVATTTLTTLAVQGTHGLSGGGATAGSTSTAAPSTPSTTTPTSTLASPIPSAPASSVNTQSTGPTSESAATSSNGATSAQESSTSAASATTNNRYTGGALAGAIVGSILGAAILTFLVTFLFFRKRFQRTPAQESRNGRSRRPSGKGLMAGDEKAALAGGAAAGVGMGWAAFLPQSADDKTIQHSVKTLYEQIELHVDNYYHKASVGLDEHTREALSKVDTGKLPGSITDLMSTQSSQLSVIKHCIADLLITRMTPGRDPSSSLLPASLSVYPSKLSQPPSHSRESAAAHQAYSQYKSITTFLFPASSAQPQNRSHQTNEISYLIYNAFSPWGPSKSDAAALQQHETTLIDTAASTGALVASQPSSYAFRWEAAGAGKSGGARSLVVLPGLWKTGDEEGRALGASQLVVSAGVVKV